MLPLNSTVEQAKLVWEMCETIDSDRAHEYIQDMCDFYTRMREEETDVKTIQTSSNVGNI